MSTSPDVVLDNLVFGESPRWHDGRLWVSDWGAGEVLSVVDGRAQVEARVRSFPMCIDFLPDGRLLVVSAADGLLLRREADGSLVTHADLGVPCNDIVVDDQGSAYVNCVNFEFPGGEFRPGYVLRVSPMGDVERVAEGFAFPNGMAITPDGRTLLVAESYAEQLTACSIDEDGRLSERRVWATTPGDHPDGICVDADGAVWYADVGNRRCVRVTEGEDVLDVVEFDRGAFACVLSRATDPVLYVVGQEWRGPDEIGGRTGRVVAFPAPAPGAGHP